MSIEEITEGIEENLNRDVSVDHIKLIEWAAVIARVSSLVLGILAIGILILIPIVCSLEIMYITLPTLRSTANKILFDGRKGFAQRTLEFTLRDAIKAIERAETIEMGENTALWIYLKIKLKAIMIEVFLVVFIAFGGGSSLIHAAEHIFQGVFEVLFGVQFE